MMCLVIFTIGSLLCGTAPSLATIILFRILQGAGGGGLQPMAQAILADTFPPEKRGVAFALYGITAVIAPTIGPILGGWITDNYSWRWIFFINLPTGILALFLVHRLVEDPPWVRRTAGPGVKIDYIGVALLALGVGALQVMLDKGQLAIVYFASLVMRPQFLQTLLGYTAASAGLVLSGGGLLLLFLMPVIGILSSKVRARYRQSGSSPNREPTATGPP
jgi:DHA2 family multidrug resistance protein